MYKGPEHLTGSTGDITEGEMFGSIKIEATPENREKALHLRDLATQYMRYNDALETIEALAEMDKTYNPESPKTFFARDLYSAVSEGLGLSSGAKLKFYTTKLANGKKTHFDVNHGVDAFFELVEPGEKSVVTLDATQNPKHTRARANILVIMQPGMLDPSLPEDKAEYQEKVKNTARVIIDIFKNKSYYKKVEV